MTIFQENNQPIPIKFELTPIINLFNVDNLDDRYNVTSKDILDWFLPLYIKYCKVNNWRPKSPLFSCIHSL